MQDMTGGHYRSRMKPHAALQSILAFQVRHGVPFMRCGTRAGAEFAAFYFLRHYLREVRERLKILAKAYWDA